MVIALAGHSGSGKDTVHGILNRNHGLWTRVKNHGLWTRVSIADNVRALLLALDPLVEIPHWCSVNKVSGRVDEVERLSLVVNLWGWPEAQKIPEVRRMLQSLGAGARDILGPDIWLHSVLSRLEGLEGRNAVITDCRYENELLTFGFEFDALRVWVSRPGVGPLNNHETEQPLERHCDFILNNDGSLADLERAVGGMMSWADGQEWRFLDGWRG